jgi:hypothetical protein
MFVPSILRQVILIIQLLMYQRRMPSDRTLSFHSSQLSSNRHIVGLACLWEALDLNALPEQQAVRASTKVEHTSLLALLHMLSFLDSDLTGRHLVHANSNESHETDCWIVRFDEDDRARGQRTEVALSNTDTSSIDLLVVVVA